MSNSVFKRGASAILPALLIVVGVAMQPAAGEPLALHEVIEYSLQHSGELKSFREEKGIRDAAVARAKLLPNPTLELEGETGALTGSSDENSVSIGISQEFPLSGKREKRLEKAKRESDLYLWQLADRERRVRRDSTEAFYDVLLAKERVLLAERALALNRQLLDVTKERLAAGDIPELEMNVARVEVARSQGAQLEAEVRLETLQSHLATLMGMPDGEAPAVSGSLEAVATGPSLKQAVAALKELAREKRPDLKALEAEREVDDADVTLAKAEAIPDLTAGVLLKRDKTAMEVGGIEGTDTAYKIGVRLSMPIPLFNRNEAGVRQATARRSSSESRLAAARKAVDWEVETAYTSLVNAEKVISLYRSQIIPQLRENLDLTQEAYRLGEIDILSIIQENRKFYEVSDSYLAALHERQTALAKLEAAVSASLTGGLK